MAKVKDPNKLGQAALKKLALSPEFLATAAPDRPACMTCGLFGRCETPFLKPYVPVGWTHKLLVVFGEPAPEDEAAGRLARGDAARHLRRLLRKAGYSPLDVAYATVLRCRSRQDKPAMTSVRACRPYLLQTIKHLRPEVIIGLGGTALRAFTDAGDEQSVVAWRGRLIDIPGAEGAQAWITYDPQGVLDGATHLNVRILEDLRRPSWTPLDFPANSIADPLVGSPAPEHGVIALDTEWDKDGNLLAVGCANSIRAAAMETSESLWREWLTAGLAPAVYLAGHSLSGDVDNLVKLGLAKREWVDGTLTRDSLLLARMNDENRGKGGYNVESLVLSSYRAKPWKDETERILDTTGNAADWTPEQRVERCRLDAWGSALLVRDLAPKLDQRLVEFTHQVAMTIHRLKLAGAVVDMRRFHAFGEEWRGEVEKNRDIIVKAAHIAGMTEFAPTNDNHVRELLYTRLRMPVVQRTDGGAPAVDKTTLKYLATEAARTDPLRAEILAKLLAFNKAEKLLSTWYGGDTRKSDTTPLVEVVRPFGEIDGVPVAYLPVNINPLGARTGRRSSSGEDEATGERISANMQNWPKSVRTIIRSRFPGGFIADNDYSKLEVVLIAWLAEDEKLFDYFYNGDGYIGVGREMFGKEVVKDTPEYTTTKSTVLAVHYNAGDWKLAWQLWYKLNIRLASTWDGHIEEAGKIRRRYLKLFPGISRFIKSRERELLDTGQVVAVDGAVRHLPVPDGRDTPGYKHKLNEAVNFPVQRFASTVTGAALIDCERELCREYGVSLVEYHKLLLEDSERMSRGEKPRLEMTTLINEVHDDVVADIFPAYKDRDLGLIHETMSAVPTLRLLVPSFDVKLKVETKANTTWAAA